MVYVTFSCVNAQHDCSSMLLRSLRALCAAVMLELNRSAECTPEIALHASSAPPAPSSAFSAGTWKALVYA